MDNAELRELLTKEKQRLERELVELHDSGPATEGRREGSPFGKREEEAAEASEFEKRLALEKALGDLIRQVDLALQKVDRGTYGLCDLCGQPIGQERLEALPTAGLCLKCKVAKDKEGRTRPRR